MTWGLVNDDRIFILRIKWSEMLVFFNHIILFGLVSVNYSNTDGFRKLKNFPDLAS